MSAANVFLVSARLKDENRLTAYWHYVLDAVPGLGQAFVDDISLRTSLPKSKFLGAINQPKADGANRPDLLIRCQNFDLLFEHKLNAALGRQQLERYVEYARGSKMKLALLAAERIDVAAAVCGSPGYVCPRDPTGPSHFLWQDVHRIVRSFPDRLARDFAEYLEGIGLSNFDWPGFGDPLTNKESANELRSLYDGIAPIFRGWGASCRKRSNSLIYEIRRPFDPIHLINISPLQSVADDDPRIWGRVMALWIWVRRTSNEDERVLPLSRGYLRDSSPRILIDDGEGWMPENHAVILERYYYVPLHEILVASKAESQERLVALVRTVVDHLKGRGKVIRQRAEEQEVEPAAGAAVEHAI